MPQLQLTVISKCGDTETPKEILNKPSASFGTCGPDSSSRATLRGFSHLFVTPWTVAR